MKAQPAFKKPRNKELPDWVDTRTIGGIAGAHMRFQARRRDALNTSSTTVSNFIQSYALHEQAFYLIPVLSATVIVLCDSPPAL